MFGMSVHTTAIILTIVLAVIGLAYLLFGWLRKRSWRVMWRGAGFILIPVGLLIMGLMRKVVDGINAVVDWANATYMTTWVMIGLIVAGIGLVVYLIGSFVPHVSGEEANKRRAEIRERKMAALRAPGQPASAPLGPAPTSQTAKLPDGPTPPPSPRPVTSSAPATPDDKEIDDILKRHGIN
ncbi:MAG: hypothetical protein FWF36_02600 [Propionibacteriaceae bacterium]|nr:hypothetical protein [Propionibacteriaceae bacterium]